MGIAFFLACVVIALFVLFVLTHKSYSDMQIGQVIGKYEGTGYSFYVIILFDYKVHGQQVIDAVEYKVPKEYYEKLTIGNKVCFPH